MAMTTRGSGLVPGLLTNKPEPSVDMIVTYRAICVGGVMYSEGDRVKMTENDARTAEGAGRAKRYVAPPEPPPLPAPEYLPEPEGEFVPAAEPAVVKPAGKRKRIGKLIKDGG